MKFVKRVLVLILIFLPIVIYSKNLTTILPEDFYNSNTKRLESSVEKTNKDYGPKRKKKKYRGKNNKKIFGKKAIKTKNKYFSTKTPKRKPYEKYGKKTLPFAIKTNLAYNAVLISNLGLELPFKKKFSVDLDVTYNIWDRKNNVKWRNLVIMPEFRFWPNKNMEGQYFGVHFGWAKYNIGGIKMPYYNDAFYYRYEGWAIGIGASYGYQKTITGNLSFEATIGLGVIYTKYDKYLAPKCGAYWGSFKNIFIAPTKIGFSLVYVIR